MVKFRSRFQYAITFYTPDVKFICQVRKVSLRFRILWPLPEAVLAVSLFQLSSVFQKGFFTGCDLVLLPSLSSLLSII